MVLLPEPDSNLTTKLGMLMMATSSFWEEVWLLKVDMASKPDSGMSSLFLRNQMSSDLYSLQFEIEKYLNVASVKKLVHGIFDLGETILFLST